MSQHVALRAVEPDEYAAWEQADRARYIDDMVTNGGLSLDDATAKAERDWAMLLPHGVATAGHSLYFITDAASGASIGRLWLGERPPALFVYALWLDEAVRGRGLGRQAMRLVEQEARRRGLARIELNVFAANERARRLYRALGYGEVAVSMSKPVTAD